MEITDVRVIPRDDARLKGFVSITLGRCFVVRGIKIIEGKAGRLFVAMPARRKGDGTFQDIAHPITRRFRKRLEEIVLEEYHRVLSVGMGSRTWDEWEAGEEEEDSFEEA